MSKKRLLPVKKVLNIINSCKTDEEIEDCKNIVKNYIKIAEKRGIANIPDLQERLDEELLKREEELYLIKIFEI